VMRPAPGTGCPTELMIWSGPPPWFAARAGGAKLARFKTLKNSARNWMLNPSEIFGM